MEISFPVCFDDCKYIHSNISLHVACQCCCHESASSRLGTVSNYCEVLQRWLPGQCLLPWVSLLQARDCVLLLWSTAEMITWPMLLPWVSLLQARDCGLLLWSTAEMITWQLMSSSQLCVPTTFITFSQPSDAYMCGWTCLPVFQILVFHLYNNMPLYGPILMYHY